MINMLNTKLLKRNVIRSISASVFIFLVLIVTTMLYFQNLQQENRDKEFKLKIEQVLKHSIKHYNKQYLSLLRRIINGTDLTSYIKNNEAQNIYKLLESRWEVMVEEEKNLQFLRVYTKNKTILVDISNDSKKNTEDSEKIAEHISQYKKSFTGIYNDQYFIAEPIFDDTGNFEGSLILNFSLKFIVDIIKDITANDGFLFNKNNTQDYDSDLNTITIDNEIMFFEQNSVSQEHIAALQECKKIIENCKVRVSDKNFKLNIFTLNDFKGDLSAKILIFQELYTKGLYSLSTVLLITSAILLFFSIAIYFIVRRINFYNKSVSDLYMQQVQVIKKGEEYLEKTFNVLPQLLIISDGKNMLRANEAVLSFFKYDSFDSFKDEHECICDFFESEDGALSKMMGDMTWLEYILMYPTKTHKAIIIKNGRRHIFFVYARYIILDKGNHSIVTFNDVTETEELKERYEYAINGANDGLWDWDLETNEVKFSNVWKNQLGYKPDEIKDDLGEWSSRVHPDDLDDAIKDVQASHSKPDVKYRNIHRMQHKDGHWVWILDRGITLFRDDGKPYRMIGFHTDITQLKELEQQLLNSQKSLSRHL